jgi:hypothetical protein
MARKSSLARLATSAWLLSSRSRCSSFSRSAWTRLRTSATRCVSATTAATGSMVIEIVAMKASSSSRDSLASPRLNVPMPATVPRTAMPDSSTTHVATSLGGSRNAAQASGGRQMKDSERPVPSSPKATTPTSAVDASASTVSADRSANPRGRVRNHRMIAGVTIRAPARSPSHHVHQTRGASARLANPPATRLATPIDALAAVLTKPARPAKTKMSRARSNAAGPEAKRPTR